MNSSSPQGTCSDVTFMAIICPTVPAFYTKPDSIEELVDQMVGRTLDLFGFDTGDFPRWSGYEKE